MTHADFIRAWIRHRHQGMVAVAAALGTDTQWVNNTATRLRHLGVALPPMPRRARNGVYQCPFEDALDVDECNRLIGEMMS